MRGIALVVALAAGPAFAQPAPNPADKAEADRLFEEGRQLLATDRAAACAKFDLSLRKDPRAVGTMLNLAQCHEMTGEVATAVRLYEEARDRAHDQDLKEHAEAAERKLALLAPRVPHVRIVLPPNAPGATVILDQLVLGPTQLADVIADPGTRTITVTAPDKLPYETKVTLAEGEHRTITIPALEGEKTTTIIVHQSSRALAGKVTLVSGVAAGAIAIGLGLYARSLYWDEFPDGAMSGKDVAPQPGKDCWIMNGTKVCDANGTSKLATARNFAHVATGLGIASGAAVVVGALLWWTAPAARSERDTHVSVVATPDRLGLAFTRSF